MVFIIEVRTVQFFDSDGQFEPKRPLWSFLVGDKLINEMFLNKFWLGLNKESLLKTIFKKRVWGEAPIFFIFLQLKEIIFGELDKILVFCMLILFFSGQDFHPFSLRV